MITTRYVVRTAQQRDPPTAASAHGDHVYPHPAHLCHFCVLRGTCTCSLESRSVLARQATKTNTGVDHTAEDTSLYFLSATFSKKPPSPPAAQTLTRQPKTACNASLMKKPCRRSEVGSNYRFKPVLLYTAQRVTVEFVLMSCL